LRVPYNGIVYSLWDIVDPSRPVICIDSEHY
jgi:hypothetical protein